MEIDKTNTLPPQLSVLYHPQNFIVTRRNWSREFVQQPEDFTPLANLAASQLADNEWMSQHVALLQQRSQMR